MRVAIVDDVAVFRDVACELLEARGYVVVGQADSAAAAADTVARLKPDAVLLDMRLPDGNGFDVSSMLTGADPALAVLLTSTDYPTPSDRAIRACGARGFVLKSRLAATDLSLYWPAS